MKFLYFFIPCCEMIYIHIPYCHQKCTYCAFYSIPSKMDKQPYVEAVCKELEMRRKEQEHPIRTLYLGGGTPSMLSLEQLEMIRRSIIENYDLSQLEEFTLEANPEDLSEAFLKDLRKAVPEINRLSIGIQSLRDSDLKTLNRRHSGAQALEAVRNAHEAGFKNISIDLIYGLPNQTTDDWAKNLEGIEEIEPYISHLSCYALTIEEGTMLHRQIEMGTITPADEETVMKDYDLLQQWIARKGWRQYEISSYCKEGRYSRHNSRYWDHTPYLGVGAGAHSFDGNTRRWNESDAKAYIEAVAEGRCFWGEETLTKTDMLNEYLMTALRTTRGIDMGYIRQHHPEEEAELRRRIDKFIGSGLIEEIGSSISPTRDGLLHADGMAAELFF